MAPTVAGPQTSAPQPKNECTMCRCPKLQATPLSKAKAVAAHLNQRPLQTAARGMHALSSHRTSSGNKTGTKAAKVRESPGSCTGPVQKLMHREFQIDSLQKCTMFFVFDQAQIHWEYAVTGRTHACSALGGPIIFFWGGVLCRCPGEGTRCSKRQM